MDDVHQSTRFFKMYGQDYHIQNLEWSELFLEQSCTDELKKKVLESTMRIFLILREVDLSSLR